MFLPRDNYNLTIFIDIYLGQCFSTRMILPPGGHLAMSGDIFDEHN